MKWFDALAKLIQTGGAAATLGEALLKIMGFMFVIFVIAMVFGSFQVEKEAAPATDPKTAPGMIYGDKVKL